jgi:hypothetical protein
MRIIADLRSSAFSPSFSEKQFDFLENKIAFSVETKGYGFSHDEDQIARNVEAQFETARQLVAWKNSDIKSENTRLKQMIAKIIADRAQKIHQDEEKLSSLTKKISIPLKRKEDFAARNISLSSKPIIKKVKPTSTQPEDYILDHEKVVDIISYLDNQGKQFERTPKSYAILDEEALRDVFLSTLNSIFDSAAIGETFSKKGNPIFI